MNIERKLSINELIEALELHLTPRTDPDHCDPCSYNDPSTVRDGALDIPQTTCQYRLMRDCLEMLKQQRLVIIMLENSNFSSVKEFIDYYIETQYENPDNEYLLAKFAFSFGNAFANWKKLKEEENEQYGILT